MLMIDCRRCKHFDAGNDCCDIYGGDPRKAVKACADNGFKEYCCHVPQKGHGVKYVLFSPEHDIVRKEFRRADGTFVPEEVFRTSDRALYRHRLFPDRRYRQSFPSLDDNVQLLEIDSIDQALEEQAALENYCREKFEIWRWVNGRLAEKVDDVQAERILYGTSDASPVGILKKEDANENPNLL